LRRAVHPRQARGKMKARMCQGGERTVKRCIKSVDAYRI
jgi:hypothetical protein